MAIDKKSFRSGPFADFIAQAVQVRNVLYVSGQVGMDAEGNVPESVGDQAAIAYANIKAVLAEFGADMDNIVDETVFVTDMGDTLKQTPAVFGAREAAYGGKPEVAQTLVGTTALVRPELKIEIKVIAHLS